MMDQLIKSSRIITLSLVAGVVVFSLITLNSTNFTHLLSEIDLLGKIGLTIAVIGSFISRLMGNIFLRKINKNSSLTNQFQTFKTSLIVRLALLEGPALFTIVLVMLTNNYEFFMATGIMIIQMLSLYPHRTRIIGDMQLTDAEIKELFD